MSINENKYITFKGCTFNLLAGLLVRNCDLVVIHDSIFNCSNTFSTPTDDEPTAGFANIRMQMFPNDIFDLSNNHFVNSEPPYLFSNYASNAKGVYLDSHPFTSISQTNYNVHTPCAVIDSSVGPVQYYSFSDGTPYIVTDGSTISEYGIIFDNAKHALYPNS